jgi:hypothetical protein
MDAMGGFNVLLWMLWTHYLTALDPLRMGTMTSRLGVQLRKNIWVPEVRANPLRGGLFNDHASSRLLESGVPVFPIRRNKVYRLEFPEIITNKIL